MIMTNFLKNRRSVRDFKKKKADEETLKKLRGYLQVLEKEDKDGSIKFNLYENGPKLYESFEDLGGYSGIMIQSPHYVSLGILNREDKTIINSAYLMEKLISELNKLGLETCWVSIHDVEESERVKALGENKGEVNYLLAIGYSKPKNPFVNEPVSERIGVDELVYTGEIGKYADIEELDNRGLSDLFYYIRFAPSARNMQPWRFLLDDNKATLLLQNKEGESLNLMDAGIIMYYFEVLGGSIGINSKWELLEEDQGSKDSKYTPIAEIKL